MHAVACIQFASNAVVPVWQHLQHQRTHASQELDRLSAMLRVLALTCLTAAVADQCPDDAEVDLCETLGEETGAGSRNSAWMGLLLPLVSARPKLGATIAVALAAGMVGADAATCGDVKAFYKSEQCCGSPTQALSATPPGCPYSFVKPACSKAEPQTPRDLTAGATGMMTPKAATLNDAQANFLPLVNVHFHLGAEHKSESYMNSSDADAYDAASSGRRLAENPRPGFMCATENLTDAQMAPYTFQYCKGDVQVHRQL